VGDIAPLLKLEALDSRSFSGKYTLIKFWQSTCPPCLEEIEGFKDFYSRSRDEMNIVFIAVNRDKKVLNKYLVESGLDDHLPVYFDRGRINGRNYGLKRTPTSFLLDEMGVIVYKWTGGSDWSKVDAESFIGLTIAE